MVTFGDSVLEPVHFPAAHVCVQCEMTESEFIGEEVPVHVPDTSASVTATGAGGAAGAIAAAEVSAAGASSFFAHATATATSDSKINVRRMSFSRLAAEEGEVIA
jgi:hypothetical protein